MITAEKSGLLQKKKSAKDMETSVQVSLPRRDDERIVSPENIIHQQSASKKEQRRMIAEDPAWNLAIVKELNLQCIEYIVNNFTEVSFIFKLMPKNSKSEVLKKLPVSLPLHITFPLIEDEGYWSRCCKTKWRICDVKKHDGSWKIMFAEKILQEMIENFMPNTSSQREMDAMLLLLGNFVMKLNIRQMLPYLKNQEKTADESAEKKIDSKEDNDDDDDSDDARIEHLDLGLILPKLGRLQTLSIRYAVKDCGMNFNWDLFKMTTRDGYNLSKCIATDCTWLKHLNLSNNNIDDAKIRILIGNLLGCKCLEEMDLSHNKIGDRGARALAKMLSSGCRLRILVVTDNQIGAAGAGAIAHALENNTIINDLSMRLNRIGDEGVGYILKALLTNTSVRHLNMSACEMTQASLSDLQEILETNSSLRSLDISSNTLDKASGIGLSTSLRTNKMLTTFDVRQTNISKDSEIDIIEIINRNKEILK